MIDAATVSIVDDALLASPPTPRILRGNYRFIWLQRAPNEAPRSAST